MKNIQKFIQAGFVILIFSAIGFRLVEVKKERTETLNSLKESDLVVPVQTVTANKTPMNQTIIATGTFKPMKMITLKAEIQGRVEALPIEEGSCLDTSSIVCHVENQGIRDQLKSAHLELRKARKDLERYEKMAQKKAVSANQLEKARLAHQQAHTKLSTTKEQLNKTRITSPLQGKLNKLHIENGEFLNPGQPVAEIISTGKMKFITHLSQRQIIPLKKKMQVALTCDVYPGQTYRGRIRHISQNADGSGKYETTIILNNVPANPLKGGMFGTATFRINQGTGMVLPRECLVGSSQNPGVYVIRHGVAERLPIVIERITPDKIWVQSGVTTSQQVVTTGQINLEDGIKVRINN
jgi:RND family efflux transporter MFP subunit